MHTVFEALLTLSECDLLVGDELCCIGLQVRFTDVEMLAGSPEGQPLASAARQWAAFDGSTGALHRLSNSDDYISVQLHGAGSAPSIAAPMLSFCFNPSALFVQERNEAYILAIL
jgi:hypothetical protein